MPCSLSATAPSAASAAGGRRALSARDERLERDVAIKRIHGAEVTATTAKRLWREARIMASLRHPNLVAIYDIVVDGEDLLFVMEYSRADARGRSESAPLRWGALRSCSGRSRGAGLCARAGVWCTVI